MWNPSTCDYECKRHVKLMNTQVLETAVVKNVSLVNQYQN